MKAGAAARPARATAGCRRERNDTWRRRVDIVGRSQRACRAASSNNNDFQRRQDHDGQLELEWQPIVTLETNIDDCSPQILSYAQQQLFSCGALDVYTLPSNMKKGRSGGAVILGVVCLDNQPIIDSLTKTIFRETTSLGVRMMTGTRCALTREIILVETKWGRVHVKVGLLNGDIMNVHPEYDDAASIASTNGVPLKDVMHEATKNANLMLMEQYSEQDV